MSVIHAIQPAFTAGEISEEVASRVDLEKYQLALLTAENALLRPYGGLYKRTGMLYHGPCVYHDKQALLVRFNFTESICYLLEAGQGYINIWRDGVKLPVQLATPWTEADLPHLRFTQSADVMYITSGRCPVQVITRYSESDWRMAEFRFENGPFEPINPDADCKVYASGTAGSVLLNSSKDVFLPGQVGALLKISHFVEEVSVNSSFGAATAVEPAKISVGIYTVRAEVSGTWAGSVTWQGGSYSRWTNIRVFSGNGSQVFDNEYTVDNDGSTHTQAYYREMRFSANVVTGSATVKLYNADTDALLYEEMLSPVSAALASMMVGSSWKLITNEKWTGKISLEYRPYHSDVWRSYRTYSSKEDYNVVESGTVEEYGELRLVTHSGFTGTVRFDLSAYAYTHESVLRITSYANARQVQAAVEGTPLATTGGTADWNMGAWNAVNGYPYCATFFQDRLVFAGSAKFPNMVWMSRTGDYPNFGVEKAGGDVTDDSAVQQSLISRELFKVQHLIPGQDLIVLTEGNEWMISGSEIVTPKRMTPKLQTARGVSEVPPQFIGNRIVYVQRRGATVRDMGYSYDSDNYTGMDLTLLAKHLVKGHRIVDATYSQEPDSVIYFVRGDGVLLCLTYIREQEVYAWSRIVTDGAFEAVTAIPGAGGDTVYAIVRRVVNGQTRRYVESFAPMSESGDPLDHIMVDVAKVVTNSAATATIDGLDHLEGESVVAVGDSFDLQPTPWVVTNGRITLPAPCKKVIVGLPYTLKVEQPNFEMQLRDGTMQGRSKVLTGAVLRMRNSFGGRVGCSFSLMDEITYEDRAFEPLKLFSGDKQLTPPQEPSSEGGFNTHGRLCLMQDEPYPFAVNAIIRQVSFGG